MPIYEYQCKACGHRLEKLQKISDDPLRYCTACEAPMLTKLVSAAAFRLKGAGWYETDFKTGKKKNVSQTDKSDSSDTSSGSSSSSSSSSSKESKSQSNSGTSSAANN